MKSTTRSFLLFGFLAVSAAVAVPVATAASVLVENFSQHGMISAHERGSSTLVINGKIYILAGSTKIYSQEGQVLPASVLRPGTVIRFNLESDRSSVIREILLLPAS